MAKWNAVGRAVAPPYRNANGTVKKPPREAKNWVVAMARTMTLSAIGLRLCSPIVIGLLDRAAPDPLEHTSREVSGFLERMAGVRQSCMFPRNLSELVQCRWPPRYCGFRVGYFAITSSRNWPGSCPPLPVAPTAGGAPLSESPSTHCPQCSGESGRRRPRPRAHLLRRDHGGHV